MPAKLKAAVLGSTGYTGLELTRLLLRHPRLEQPALLQREKQTETTLNLAEIFPVLSGNGSYPLQPLSWPALRQQGVQLLFLATPHQASRSLVPEAIAQGLRVIDLSGAWRLKREQHRAVYGFEDADSVAAADLTEMAIYGLPELHRDRDSWRSISRESGVLRDFGNPRFSAAARGWNCRSRAWNHFRFQIWGLGCGQGAQFAHPLCFCCRQPFGVLGVRSSARGRDARAVATEYL